MLRLRSSFGALANAARTHRTLIAIVLAALLLRAALLPLYARLPNGYLDEGFWKFWMRMIHERGVLNIFRATDPDYVGYQWVLWLLSLVFAAIGGSYVSDEPTLHVLVKIPALIFDVALIVAVYYATELLAASSQTDVAKGDGRPGQVHAGHAARPVHDARDLSRAGRLALA